MKSSMKSSMNGLFYFYFFYHHLVTRTYVMVLLVLVMVVQGLLQRLIIFQLLSVTP